MIKWILLGSVFYLISKAIYALLSIFKISKPVRNYGKKERIHMKVSKMDIQDAEFEDH